MSAALSLYLDCWRLAAALAVFGGHLSGARFTAGFLWPLNFVADQAVAVFFVLSGFVIAHASAGPGMRADRYVVARLARLYSVAAPALVLTFALDALGRALRPDLYGAGWGYQAGGQGWQFLSGLFFINRVWGLETPQGSDLPYWSLGYEAWFYVIFGVARFAPCGWRVAGALAVTCLAGPQIAAMLPLWLAGAGAYSLSRDRLVGRRAGLGLFASSLAVWIAYQIWGEGYLATGLGVPALLHRPRLAEDYGVGLLFLANLVGIDAVISVVPSAAVMGCKAAHPTRAAVGRALRWGAGATFTIYLLHLPVAQFLATVLRWPPQAWQTRLVLEGGTLTAMFALAEATERRKAVWARGFRWLATLPARRVHQLSSSLSQ